MNAEEYKRLINEVEVLDHTTLNVTLKEVVSQQEFEIAKEIQRILKDNKIPKPVAHQKPFDTSTNYYKVDLSDDHIGKVIDMLFDLEASQVGEDGETTPTAAFYASLVDKWNKLG